MQFLKLTSEIQQGLDAGYDFGVQACIMRQGEVLLDAGYGRADVETPMTADHYTLWKSATKPITAMGVARLWERGKVNLQEPVATYVPEFAQQGKESMTVYHLLTHTGGMRSADIGWKPRPWEKSIELICSARKEPNWPVGEKAGYHIDSSWYMLGEIIRRVDGRSVSQYLRDELFQPLGCGEGWVGMPEPEVEYYQNRIARVYDTSVDPVEEIGLFTKPSVLTLARPGANGRGPARTLAVFYSMLLQGGRWQGRQLFKPETVAEWTRRHRLDLFDHSFQHVMDWGLGFHVNSNHHGVDTVPYGFGPHASRDTYGHGGNRSSTAFGDPQHGLAVAIVCNGMAEESVHQMRMRRMLAAVYEDLGISNQ